MTASTVLAWMVTGGVQRHQVIGWWLAIVGSLALRSFDAFYSHARRSRSSTWNGNHEIRRFACGVGLTAAIWILFPLLYFYGLDPIGRTTMAIVLSAMAGGSATVLAPSLAVGISYCATMLLPASIMFFRAGGTENRLLGFLGVTFFGIMVISTRVSHASTMMAIRLNRVNQSLLVEVEGQRNLSEQRNAELKTAQFALRKSNLSLESRIKARTVDLEREIAERERYAQELCRLASTDPLTGLYNRAMLSDRLIDTLASARKTGERIAVFFVDLDKFKEVNDVRGHHTGDRVLKIAAERLAESLINCRSRCRALGRGRIRDNSSRTGQHG